MSDNLIIVFDTETTGFSPERNEIVQLSYILYDIKERRVVYATKQRDDFVDIKGNIPKKTSDVHGITKDMTIGKRRIRDHIDEFIIYCDQAKTFVGHNIKFDINMITGQMKKVMMEFPDTEERYRAFLERFEMVGSDLPEAAYCTMKESKGICAQILGLKKAKFQKLMEVHKLLFNQDVGGQLHNALVDISVTLRVYLKLTLDIDICESQTEFDRNVTEAADNVTICSLINPINIEQPTPLVDYTGELITSLSKIPDGLEEEKVMVETIAKNFVSEVQKQAISNVMEKIAPHSLCTNISICKSIIKSGKRQGETCGRPVAMNNEFCGLHNRSKGNRSKGKKVAPNEDESIVREKPKPETTAATTYVSSLFNKFTRKNKVVPKGGKRRKRTKKIQKRRKTIKKRTKNVK